MIWPVIAPLRTMICGICVVFPEPVGAASTSRLDFTNRWAISVSICRIGNMRDGVHNSPRLAALPRCMVFPAIAMKCISR